MVVDGGYVMRDNIIILKLPIRSSPLSYTATFSSPQGWPYK